jgi:1,4-alpha-glucan branching enzyme
MESVGGFLKSNFGKHGHPTRALIVVCLFAFLMGCASRGQLTQNSGQGKQVRFVYVDYQASDVSIVGSFTHWKPRPMKKNGKEWWFPVSLTPGRYLYAFIINGHIWQTDPAALLVEDDGFGNRNSVLVVE